MNWTEIHNMLIAKGFKVHAVPDHDKDPEKLVTMYKHPEGFQVDVIMPEERQRQLVEAMKKHPVTGSTTTEQAQEMLFEATKVKNDE